MNRISFGIAAAAFCFAGTAFGGTFGSFTIGAGFMPDPQIQSGTSGGSRDASIFGSSCRGTIAVNPDHTINVTSTVNLKAFATSPDDSTLVITGPGGTFCDDDSHGNLNPEVNAVLTPGTYQVFVGEFGGGNSQYQLTLTENLGQAAAAPAPTGGSMNGTYGTFTLGAGFMPDPQIQNGTSGGSRDASMYGSSCRGTIASNPDHVINVTSAVNLKVFATSPDDSTLVITGPGGTFCDDDSHGNLNPEVNAYLTPGSYQVFVGEFGGGNSPYQLTVTENL